MVMYVYFIKQVAVQLFIEITNLLLLDYGTTDYYWFDLMPMIFVCADFKTFIYTNQLHLEILKYMKNDDSLSNMVHVVSFLFIIILMVGIWIGATERIVLKAHAIKRGYAEYNSTNGNWQWKDK